MAATIPTTEPAFATAGDTLAWRRSLPDYPAGEGWTLKYRLVNATAKIDITASADGDDYLISVAAATSSAWTAGAYAWVAWVEGGSSERYTVDQGSITIEPDIAAVTAAGYDARSEAEQALANLRSLLASFLATNGQINETRVGDHVVVFASADEIRKRIAVLELEVAREQRAEALAKGLPTNNRVLVRFGGE